MHPPSTLEPDVQPQTAPEPEPDAARPLAVFESFVRIEPDRAAPPRWWERPLLILGMAMGMALLVVVTIVVIAVGLLLAAVAALAAVFHAVVRHLPTAATSSLRRNVRVVRRAPTEP